jgi:TPR repeat protein
VPQNYAEALKWFREAADHGDHRVQRILGGMYESGEGVLENYVQAHMWYNLAAANPAWKKEDRDELIRSRDRVARKMTLAQIAEAQKLASEWKPKPER